MTKIKTTIGFLIFPGFPMACLTSVIEPLRAANEIADQTAFSWHLISERGGRVMSSAQVAFEAEQKLADIKAVDFLFCLSAPTARFMDLRQGNGCLRTLARHGTTLGAISGGVFPLARSGQLTGQPVSVHWCYEAAFKAEFPDINARSDVIVRTERRTTVSGAAAAFDLALILIADKLGRSVADEVACWFQHPLVRGEGVQQQVPVTQIKETGTGLPHLVDSAIKMFAAKMSEPISVAEIAHRSNVTPRQIERAFKKATGQSPSHYYRAMRMRAARQLVMYSKDPIPQIAAAVGYGSSTPLITHYKAAFNITPSEDRKRINQFRVEGNAPVPTI